MVRVVTQGLFRHRFVRHGLRLKRYVVMATLATTLAAGSLVTSVAPASAVDEAKPPVVDTETLTPRQLADQVKAADALRAELMKSSAQVAAANIRLERLSAQASTLLANLSAARTAEHAAQADAATQKARLIQLGVEVRAAQDSLGRLASDSYIRGGGPLGDFAAILEALTAPSADQSTDSMATVQYLMDGRARVFDRMRSLRAQQVITTAKAAAAVKRATAAAKRAAAAKSALDVVILDQRTALQGFRATQTDQIGRAAGLRGALLRSEDAAARAVDKQLAEALAGQDFTLLMDESSSCGESLMIYPNGRFPPSALCPLYAAPGESLTRNSSMAFNAMSIAYQHQSGFGLAVDLCGGVQNFADPAHLWMQRNAPLYGWFHPAWAGPSGSMPEPWHWEFAN